MNNVGANIVNILTESLYDNPIVVFREYVQNAIDSIYKTNDYLLNCEINITVEKENIIFIDNGGGIKKDQFENEMIKKGASKKNKQTNLGYKGIGRLAGIPYCNKLYFININNYNEKDIQIYSIDCSEYNKMKSEDLSEISFDELMKKIGDISTWESGNIEIIDDLINKNAELFKKTNTGFIVLLESISSIIIRTIQEKDFKNKLEWLLPVDFESELYNLTNYKELFNDLKSNEFMPIKSCKICYNNQQLYRPINKNMLRKYVCKSDFDYAIGFHTFNSDRICIESNNQLSGIRIYIDNMLLCDENEILSTLDKYGLLDHSINGQIQSIRGIGAMIYITDKINISSNARRTFIEVIDGNAIKFLQLLNEFINTVYDTRYALSNYASMKEKGEKNTEKIAKLKNEANQSLGKLANEKIILPEVEEKNFDELTEIEKKRLVKNIISTKINEKIKDYIKLNNINNIDSAFEDFLYWVNENSK